MAMYGSVNAFAAALCVLAQGRHAAAQCNAVWSDDFSPPSIQPFTAASMTAFDDGSGLALFIGCSAVEDYEVPQTNLVRWDGAQLTPYQLFVDGEISALAVFDDGSGPALYAGGNFTTIAGAPASAIARWNGEHWQPLGIGMEGQYWPAQVMDFAVFDDGTGPALYAAGDFIAAGGKSASNIARWDGANWSPLGAGCDSWVQSLAVHDDGNGPALYAGGYFLHAGNVEAAGIARWDGTSWSPLGAGLTDAFGDPAVFVYGLCEYNDGTGAALYAGGSFTLAGGTKAWAIARWKDGAWSEVGGGLNSWVGLLEVFDGGTGPRLVVGSDFQFGNEHHSIASWDGHSWRRLGGGVQGPNGQSAVTTVGVLDRPDALGPSLLTCGDFESAGDVVARDIASWDGTEWSAVIHRTDNGARSEAFVVHDDGQGSGPCLYAGGGYYGSCLGIGRWDGTTWSMVGSGAGVVNALAVYDEGFGQGPFLFAGNEGPGLVRWNGFYWKNMGPGVNGRVYALAVFDDGSGPALYIGGKFRDAHGFWASMARWDGSEWDNTCDTLTDSYKPATVLSLQVYDDKRGSGPALFAGGRFNRAGDLVVGNIARWDGAEWAGLNLGANKEVQAMAVHDADANGPQRPRLCIGGLFTQVGAHTVRGLASWDGKYWAPLGDIDGNPYNGLAVRSLESFDPDADGPAPPMLYAAGTFDSINGAFLPGLARHNGAAWEEVGGGLENPKGSPAQAYALRAVDVPSLGQSLFVGGLFDLAGGIPSPGMARYGCPPPPPCYPDLDASGALDLFDFLAFVNLFHAQDPAADCDASGALDLFDFLCFTNAFNAGC
jgi:hypothetical protein